MVFGRMQLQVAGLINSLGILGRRPSCLKARTCAWAEPALMPILVAILVANG